MRGLETFSQLITWQYDYNTKSNAYIIQHVPILINDFPRFQLRGLLIDSSRHYLPPSAVRSMLDAMSYNKMNFLHWHLVSSNHHRECNRLPPHQLVSP